MIFPHSSLILPSPSQIDRVLLHLCLTLNSIPVCHFHFPSCFISFITDSLYLPMPPLFWASHFLLYPLVHALPYIVYKFLLYAETPQLVLHNSSVVSSHQSLLCGIHTCLIHRDALNNYLGCHLLIIHNQFIDPFHKLRYIKALVLLPSPTLLLHLKRYKAPIDPIGDPPTNHSSLCQGGSVTKHVPSLNNKPQSGFKITNCCCQ